MSENRSSRGRYALNPFVVLSDVTLTLILLLLFYIAALTLTARASEERLKQQIVLKEQEAAHLRSLIDPDKQKEVQRIDARKKDTKAAFAGMLVEEDVSEQVFTFGADELFPAGGSKLSSNANLRLLTFGKRLGKALETEAQQYGAYPEIQIQGHTDTLPADNWTLSMNRALEVVRLFSFQRRNTHFRAGLRLEHLSAAGYSCHRPRIAPPPDATAARREQGQAANRRIEIRLIYTSRPLRAKKFTPNAPFACDWCDKN